MSNIPNVDTEDVYKNVISKLSSERAEHLVQIASLENVASKLLTERDEAIARAVSAEESLKDGEPSEEDSE